MSYKAPSIQRPREIFDSHGRPIGQTEGFVPDTDGGGLGIELEIDPEAQDVLDTDLTRAWLSSDKIIAVRKDRMVLDLSARELRMLLRERSLEELTAPPELDESEIGREI